MRLAASSTRNSTSGMARARAGKNDAATASWTKTVSAALHTPGREVFAFLTISSAWVRSAVSSTKI